MYKLKKRKVEKLRIIYGNGYTHELWVYNLKVSKEGEYSWTHFEPGNRIIDLQPNQIISIFVIKTKHSWYFSKVRKKSRPKPKPETILNQFKPKPISTDTVRDGGTF